MLAHRQLIVYLDGAALRGTLQTIHARILDELHDIDGSLRLHHVTRLEFARNERTRTESESDRQAVHARVVVSKRHIMAVTDLSDAEAPSLEHWLPREQLMVALAVGPYWLRGRLHLPVGMEPSDLLGSAGPGYAALTDARLFKAPDAPGRTVLVNREHISCIAAES
jgi:hypothetical protein